MTHLDLYEPALVGGRTYVPLLVLDCDGRQTGLRVPDRDSPPRYSRVVRPFACADCGAMTIDPAAHNVAHDGPACRVCGCAEDNACPDICWWVEPDLCSTCARDAEAGASAAQLVEMETGNSADEVIV